MLVRRILTTGKLLHDGGQAHADATHRIAQQHTQERDEVARIVPVGWLTETHSMWSTHHTGT